MRMHAFEDRIDYDSIVVTVDWVATKADLRRLIQQLRAMPEAEKAARRRWVCVGVILRLWVTRSQVEAVRNG